MRSGFGAGAVGLIALVLAGCGGGGSSTPPASQSSSPPPPPPTTTTQYSIGGSVTGLSGTGLVLQDNGGDNLPVSQNGSFTFATKVNSGAAYAVTVMTQPSNPTQTCTVANGSGTATANVTTVAVTCTTASSNATIGGTVTGLTGSGLVLQDNGGDNLTVTKNGSFTFATALATGTAYAVTVATQPGSPSQTCTVANGTGTTAGTNVTSVMVYCPGKFAYTADNTGGKIYGYSIDPNTGALTAVSGSPFSGLNAPAVVAIAPNGKFAFAASDNGTKIHAYTIDPASGALTEAPGSPFTITGFTVGMPYPDIGVDSQSAHLYIASAGDGLVAGFAIDQTSGALTPLAGSPYPAGAGADQIPAFTPDGKFLYVMNGTANTVSGYAVDPTSGVLTPLATAFPTGTDPSWISFTPDGKFAYVSNMGEDTISAYSVGADGSLNPLPGSPFPTDEHPQDLTIDPAGTHLYAPVANGSTPGAIDGFTINADGSLTKIAGSGSWAVGVGPKFVDVDPTGRFAYVSSAGAPGGDGVYGFSIDPTTGALTALTGSPFATGPAGSTNTEPQFITVDPSGQFGYTADEGSGTITGFAINQTTGVLTPVPGSPYALPGGKPFFVSISPEAPGIRD